MTRKFTHQNDFGPLSPAKPEFGETPSPVQSDPSRMQEMQRTQDFYLAYTSKLSKSRVWQHLSHVPRFCYVTYQCQQLCAHNPVCRDLQKHLCLVQLLINLSIVFLLYTEERSPKWDIETIWDIKGSHVITRRHDVHPTLAPSGHSQRLEAASAE